MDIKETTKTIASKPIYSDDTTLNVIRYTFSHSTKPLYTFEHVGDVCKEVKESLTNPNAPKPAKVVDKYYFKQYGEHLTKEVKEHIGKMFADSLQDETYELRLTLGCEGSAEDYYHEDSCWWGGYGDSREYVRVNGGGAFRAYTEDNDLVGRVWFLPANNGIVIFNSYGNNSLQHTEYWSKLISEFLNQPCCKTRFHLIHNKDFYLNHGVYYYIGPDVKPNMDIDLRLKEFTEREYGDTYYCLCERCGEEIYNEDNAYYTNDGNMCESCFEDHYIYIESEGEYYDVEDCVNLRRGRYDEWFLISSNEVVEDYGGNYQLAENCIEDVYGNYYLMDEGGYFMCEHDEQYYPIDELITLADGRNIADSNYDPEEHGPKEGEAVEDVYGDFHFEDSDTYFTCDNSGDIYPTKEKLILADGRVIALDNYDSEEDGLTETDKIDLKMALRRAVMPLYGVVGIDRYLTIVGV